MSTPIVMTTIIFGGMVAISALGRWAQEVTEALTLLLAAVAVMVAIMSACALWPNYCARLFPSPDLTEKTVGGAATQNP